MGKLPVPERSQALFIGVDQFASLDNLPAVEQNLSTLADLFAGDVWGLGGSRCRQLLNAASMREVDQAIFEAAHAAADTLLLYYAGHGLLDLKGRLHLAMPDSDPQAVHSTAFPYEWVRMGLAASRAQRCIVVLDCCFSARAMGVQSAHSSMAQLAEAEGTYVLAAAAENAVALAPPGETYTAFSGALVRVLTDGIADAPELLDLDMVFQGMQSILKRQGRPDPQCLSRNQVGRAAFVRNRAHTAETTFSLQEAVEDLHRARTLADTLQAVADGMASGLGYDMAVVNLVRPDGDLVVAACAGRQDAGEQLVGSVDSRAHWDRLLAEGQSTNGLPFVAHAEGQVVVVEGVPQWYTDGTGPRAADEWHSHDRLLAPMYTPGVADGTNGELIGVLSVGEPLSQQRPSLEQRQALKSYAFQATIAINNARLRSNMQRALVRLEREQQAIRASEESFRQAFEYAPSGMAIAEMGGDHHGRILRTNDALCRMLGRPASALRRYSFSDLVHPDDMGMLLRTAAEGGRVELRLGRQDGTFIWVSLRNSVVADAADGPRFLLTNVEDIQERKLHAFQLEHRASHDPLTDLPNGRELRARLSLWVCAAPGGEPDSTSGHSLATPHTHLHAPTDGENNPPAEGLAVLSCDLDGFKGINERFGHNAGDAVLTEVARRLTRVVQQPDTVARLGGDHFVILANGLNLTQAHDLAVRLRNEIIQPFRVDSHGMRVGASIGISWGQCGVTVEEILHRADQQMYIAKRSHRTQRFPRPATHEHRS